MTAQLDKKKLLKYLKERRTFYASVPNRYPTTDSEWWEAKAGAIDLVIFLIRRGDFDTQKKGGD